MSTENLSIAEQMINSHEEARYQEIKIAYELTLLLRATQRDRELSYRHKPVPQQEENALQSQPDQNQLDQASLPTSL